MAEEDPLHVHTAPLSPPSPLGGLAGPMLGGLPAPHNYGNRLHRYELISCPLCIEQRAPKFLRERLRLIVDLE